MDIQQAGGRQRREDQAGGSVLRRRERGSWRLAAAGLDHDTALAALHERVPSVGPWPRCRVGHDGSIKLNVPGRNQNAKFRGRLHHERGTHGGSAEPVVSGVVLETLSGIMVPLIFGLAALLMLGVFVAGALTGTVPPLVIGVVAAPLLGTMAVLFRRGRARAYDHDARRLYRDLGTLLAPLHPEPVGGSRLLTAA